jgi:hypothetical protein
MDDNLERTEVRCIHHCMIKTIRAIRNVGYAFFQCSSHKPTIMSTAPTLYTGYDEKELLAALPRTTWLLPSQRTDLTKVRDVKRKRKMRDCYPSGAKQQKMLDVAQGTKEWLGYRDGNAEEGGSFGASSLSTTSGHDEYDNLQSLFLKDTGRITIKCGRDAEYYYAMDRGHVTEDIALEIYRVVMGFVVYAAGLLLHHTIPWSHTSPDAVVKMPPGIFHNIYAVHDYAFGGGEIKNPVRSAYKTKSGKRGILLAHYSNQVHNQQCNLNWPWNDFICSHSCNETSPAEAMVARGPGIFRVNETFINRVYYNRPYNQEVIRALERYHAHLDKEDTLFSSEQLTLPMQIRAADPSEDILLLKYKIGTDINDYEQGIAVHPADWCRDVSTGTLKFHKKLHKTIIGVRVSYPPKMIKSLHMPDVYILPLKTVRYYLQTPFDEEKKAYADPIDENGVMVGVVSVEVEHFWTQKPLRVTWAQLEAKSDECEELDAVPHWSPKMLPKAHEIKNPALQKLMRDHSDLNLCDIIFQLVSHQLTFPIDE